MKHPEWALKYKTKGTELRLISGTYYLYEVSSKWNPHKKLAQKITGRLLGKITPEGFIQSPKIMIDAMKNVLRADSSYMRNQTALEGWMFITFIALQLYYRIYGLLSEKQLLSKFCPQDLLMRLRDIKGQNK